MKFLITNLLGMKPIELKIQLSINLKNNEKVRQKLSVAKTDIV